MLQQAHLQTRHPKCEMGKSTEGRGGGRGGGVGGLGEGGRGGRVAGWVGFRPRSVLRFATIGSQVGELSLLSLTHMAHMKPYEYPRSKEKLACF